MASLSGGYPDYESAGIVPFAFDRKNGTAVFLMAPEDDTQTTPNFSDFASPRIPAQGNAAETAAFGFLDEFTGKQVAPLPGAVEEIADYIDNSPEHSHPFYNEEKKHLTFFVEMSIELKPGKRCMWVPRKEISDNGRRPQFFSSRTHFGPAEMDRMLAWIGGLDEYLKSGGSSEWKPPVPTAVVEQRREVTKPKPKPKPRANKVPPKPPTPAPTQPRPEPDFQDSGPIIKANESPLPAPSNRAQPSFLPPPIAPTTQAPASFNQLPPSKLLGAPQHAVTPFTGLGAQNVGAPSTGNSFANYGTTFRFGQTHQMPSSFDYRSFHPQAQTTQNSFSSWGAANTTAGGTGYNSSVMGTYPQPSANSFASFSGSQVLGGSSLGGIGTSFNNSFPSTGPSAGYSFPSQGGFSQGFTSTTGTSFGNPGLTQGNWGNIHF